MKELIEGIKLRRKYNLMPIDLFIKELELYLGKKIKTEKRDWWRFTGLNNTDMIDFIDEIFV